MHLGQLLSVSENDSRIFWANSGMELFDTAAIRAFTFPNDKEE